MQPKIINKKIIEHIKAIEQIFKKWNCIVGAEVYGYEEKNGIIVISWRKKNAA